MRFSIHSWNHWMPKTCLSVAFGLSLAGSGACSLAIDDGEIVGDGEAAAEDELESDEPLVDELDVELPDFDDDGLSDEAEADRGTDPEDPDTDGDGTPDGEEVDCQSSPLDPIYDCDNVPSSEPKDGADDECTCGA